MSLHPAAAGEDWTNLAHWLISGAGVVFRKELCL